MNLKLADRLLQAVRDGAALGATAQGASPAELAAARDRGWPMRAIAEPPALAGQALALHRAVLLAGGRFDGAAWGRALLEFDRQNRRPLEPALHRSLADLRDGVPWWRGGERTWREGASDEASCDAVARAAVLPALLGGDDDEVAAAAMRQALATDWSPATVLAAGALARLVRAAAAGREPWRDPMPAAAPPPVRDPDDPLRAWADAALRVPQPSGDSPPRRCLQAAFAALRSSRGLDPEHTALRAAAAAWPECAAETWRLGAVLGGPAMAAAACAAALDTAAGHAGRA
ncbi:MAG: ADP-ribosylglycohydrolase family protein [Planctomycetota bacterium]